MAPHNLKPYIFPHFHVKSLFFLVSKVSFFQTFHYTIDISLTASETVNYNGSMSVSEANISVPTTLAKPVTYVCFEFSTQELFITSQTKIMKTKTLLLDSA